MQPDVMLSLNEAHQHFARTLNSTVWDLLQKPDRSVEETDYMLHIAHSSCYHWLAIGTGLEWQRATWLVSRVYIVMGLADAAIHYAQRCMDLTKTYNQLMHDFDHAYAYESLARAHALAGKTDQAITYLRQAEALGASIADAEDKQIFWGDLTTGDWYGLPKPDLLLKA